MISIREGFGMLNFKQSQKLCKKIHIGLESVFFKLSLHLFVKFLNITLLTQFEFGDAIIRHYEE